MREEALRRHDWLAVLTFDCWNLFESWIKFRLKNPCHISAFEQQISASLEIKGLTEFGSSPEAMSIEGLFCGTVIRGSKSRRRGDEETWQV